MLYSRKALLARFVWFTSILCVITSCNQLSNPLDIPIAKIISNPRDYEGQRITISGTVTDAISLFVIKAFIVADNTGEIYVITERILPKKGEHVRINGSVEESFTLGAKTLTVFKEQPSSQ